MEIACPSCYSSYLVPLTSEYNALSTSCPFCGAREQSKLEDDELALVD